jgi:hypothetical protein
VLGPQGSHEYIESFRIGGGEVRAESGRDVSPAVEEFEGVEPTGRVSDERANRKRGMDSRNVAGESLY